MNMVEILKSIIFLIEGVIFLSLAIMAYWLWARKQGINLWSMLNEQDNPAMSISLCGFLFGSIIAFTGSVSVSGVSFLRHLNDVAKYSIIILLLQMAAVAIAEKFLFLGLEMKREIAEKRNVAVAVPLAAISIATGLIIVGAFSVPKNGVLLSLIWFVIGQAALLAIAKLYQVHITPYNDMAEIQQQNLAAGFALSGVLVAVGYIISHAIEGEFTSWWTDIVGVMTYIVVSLAILALMRVFTDKVILPKVNINDEIVKDKNIGAGLIEGTVYVLSAMLIAFFLT